MSRMVSNIFLTCLWTNTLYTLIYLTSLSGSERSDYDLQISLSKRHSKFINSFNDEYSTSFSEARSEALQASIKDKNSPCPKGYVVDRFNDNDCVKRFKPPPPTPCPEPNIRFGGFQMKIGGRMSQFWCEEGWNLAPPSSHAMCKLGKWDRAIPICVRPGCDKLAPPFQVQLKYEMEEAIARFECTKPWPELELIGNDVLSCDGVYWNGTLPECRKPPPTTAKPSNTRSASNANSETSSSTNILNQSYYQTQLFISVCCTNFAFLYHSLLFRISS